MIKKILYGLLALLLLLLIWHRQLVSYGISQAYGQLRIIYQARPVEAYLADPAFPDSLKQKLLLIQEIRRFAVDSLGISDSENYTTVYDQHGKPILWVVTACEPYALQNKEWKFPVLGNFSYKGFFAYEKAVKEEQPLQAQGYDTNIGEVSGWSTLGWFKDPILTSMLYRSEGQLANLIIHELTHATLYVKNNVDYNENLASFVGDQGAQLFLLHKYGKNSDAYKRYQNSKINREKYSQHVLHGAHLLDSLYATFASTDPKPTKDQRKYALIRRIMDAADTITYAGRNRLTQTDSTRQQPDEPLPNNTYFMDYIRYRSQQNQFEEEFRTKFNADFKKYLTYLKETYPSL